MRLIYIDNGIKELTFGKEYDIISFYEANDDSQYITLINDKGESYDYLIDRFMTLQMFRDTQFNKLGI